MFPIYDEDETSCPICSGPGEYIGALGTLEHFKCQSCGMYFNRVTPAAVG